MSKERQDDTVHSPWWGEHVHRYYHALTLIKNNSKVLDIACGNGFGSFVLLNNNLNFVTGGDIDEESLTYCKDKYAGERSLQFVKVDGTKMEFGDNTFDCIVSFETIEHIPDSNGFLSEIKRVLKPDGILILSTPNSLITSPDGVIKNPYHVKEFKPNELTKVLSAFFKNVQTGGQKYIRYENKPLSPARLIESFFYLRGVRKMNLNFKNSVMKLFGFPSFYPVKEDYMITFEMEKVHSSPTLFVVCKN